MDAQAMVYFNLRLALCPNSACRRKAKDLRKLLMVRKEGSYTTEECMVSGYWCHRLYGSTGAGVG